MTFEEICKINDGIKEALQEIEAVAQDEGYYRSYVWGKNRLMHQVGYLAGDPRLKSSAAYDVVLDEIVDACERGDVVYRARRAEDEKLELQGVYRNDKAKGLTCFRDCLAECNSCKCMAWRRVDEDHGYCVLIGRSLHTVA
jgi:hypothetical protein